jgi:hypothetical protein
MNEEFFDYLVINGAIEPAGVDLETGEILYSFTEKLRDIDPKMFETVVENFHQGIMALWEKGFVSIDMLSDSPMVMLTRQSLDQEKISELSPELQEALKELTRMLKI